MNNTYYQYQAANNNNPLNASYTNEYVYFFIFTLQFKKKKFKSSSRQSSTEPIQIYQQIQQAPINHTIQPTCK